MLDHLQKLCIIALKLQCKLHLKQTWKKKQKRTKYASYFVFMETLYFILSLWYYASFYFFYNFFIIVFILFFPQINCNPYERVFFYVEAILTLPLASVFYACRGNIRKAGCSLFLLNLASEKGNSRLNACNFFFSFLLIGPEKMPSFSPETLRK